MLFLAFEQFHDKTQDFMETDDLPNLDFDITLSSLLENPRHPVQSTIENMISSTTSEILTPPFTENAVSSTTPNELRSIEDNALIYTCRNRKRYMAICALNN